MRNLLLLPNFFIPGAHISTWDFQQCGMCDQQSLRSAWAYAQSDQSLCLSLECSMNIKLLTDHRLEFLSLKGGCRCLSRSTLIKLPYCWKSQVAAQMYCHLVIQKMLPVLICFIFSCRCFFKCDQTPAEKEGSHTDR